MKRNKVVLRHEFVEFIPKEMEDGTIYVSIPYATAAHKCVCGCDNQVITPFTPTDWQFMYDGETISLHPSIGNWSLPCRSHYWLRHNRVTWARQWSQLEIDSARANDRRIKNQFYNPNTTPPPDPDSERSSAKPDNFWQRLKRWLF